MNKESLLQTGRIRKSPNYRNGAFQNLSPTPMKPDDVSYFQMIREAWKRPKAVRPARPLPAVKTDLSDLHPEYPAIVWFGHSSYLIHCRGVNILVDPVFCGHASPFSFLIKAFAGTDIYSVADMPDIDALILTHNHYDHCDLKTIAGLKPKIKACYAPLGTGATLQKHLNSPLREMDWWERADIAQDFRLTAAPARHFSGRSFKRNGSLWASFVLELFGFKLYLGGDSGYDLHFKEIGAKEGPFDLAILECGQYNTSWPLIHMTPEETVQASVDLLAQVLLPVHWGKFALANHPWDEPVRRALKKADELKVKITTPRIGEVVVVSEHYPAASWWEKA